jgi:hypothetical protein
MPVTNDDLNAFHRFAETKLAAGGAQSLYELVDIWEIEHPTPEAYSQNVAAVRASIRDMMNGDTGRPAEIVASELRAELAGRHDS